MQVEASGEVAGELAAVRGGASPWTRGEPMLANFTGVNGAGFPCGGTADGLKSTAVAGNRPTAPSAWTLFVFVLVMQ